MRDSVNPETGKIGNEGEVRCDLSTSSIVTMNGFSSAELVPVTDGWLKLSVDVKTDDGSLFVYVGLLSSTDDNHTFVEDGEQLLLGGIEVNATPGQAAEVSPGVPG